jgi:integrase
MLFQSLTSDLRFDEAFKRWLSHRRIEGNDEIAQVESDASYLAPKTLKDYEACGLALGKFFGKLALKDIHLGHLREYQRSRAVCDRTAGSWEKPCGANRIRKEVVLLIRILKAAGVWTDADELHFQPLRRVENDVPRAMSPEEQHRFMHLASSRSEFAFVYWYSILALQTTASTNELRSLRFGDIFLREGNIMIRRAGAKNKYRIRTIPLVTPDVAWALDRLMERARELGASAPHHYLFPIQEAKGYYDPTRPMGDSGLKKRWDVVRKAANLAWLRPYDLRHTAITRMAESGMPIQVIMAMAGHMTLRMQMHYTAVSMASKREWAYAALTPNAPKPDSASHSVTRAAAMRKPAQPAPRPVTSIGSGWAGVKSSTWQL